MKKSKRSKTENQIEIIDGIAFDEFRESTLCGAMRFASVHENKVALFAVIDDAVEFS